MTEYTQVMMDRLTKACLCSFLLTFPGLCLAAPHYGANLSIPVVTKEPHLKGYQFMLNYDPDRFKWRQFNIYFDGGFSYFSTNSNHSSTVNIYSIAPVVRYTFRKHGPVHPFLELSIGVAYLNKTRFQDRNLGIHFAFQDRMGVGALLGTSEQLSVGLHALHYSNAHLSHYNAGITVPVVLDVGYRFS